MIFDAVGYEFPDEIRRVLFCGSESERRLLVAARFGDVTFEEISRKAELDQFYACAGKSYAEYRRTGAWEGIQPWLVTAIRWPTDRFSGVGFEFKYEKRMPHTQSLINSVNSYLLGGSLHFQDKSETGSIVIYPGEYDERINRVLRNFIEVYDTSSSYVYSRNLPGLSESGIKMLEEFEMRVKEYLTAESKI